MNWVMNLAVLSILAISLGCTLEASLIGAEEPLITQEVRPDRDYQNTEVAVSGSYQIQGQIAETTERKISGHYVVEGVIAYE